MTIGKINHFTSYLLAIIRKKYRGYFMEKVIKSIRLLLFFALIQLGLCSCIFWSGTSLALKQSCFYFLLALLALSGTCAFIHYLSSNNLKRNLLINRSRFIFLFYSMMIVVNLCGVGLVLSETIVTVNLLQKEAVDLILPSFFFLFGVDLVTFLPFRKWRRLQKNSSSKEVRLSIIIISILIFLRNPITILSITFYIGLGALFLSFLFPKNLRQEVSFYGHLIRDILFVVCTFLLW